MQRKRNWVYAFAIFLGVFLTVIVVRALLVYFTTDVQSLKRGYVHLDNRQDPPRVEVVRSRPWDWISYGEISAFVKGAVVVSEDWSFYSHEGYDVGEIRAAIKEDIKARSFKRGASTITQQMIKNVFLSREKTLFRKLSEFLLATKVEKALTKRKILEVYLNVVEFGPRVYGIRKAASYYFKKLPSQLGPKEAAFLAMVLPSPKRYSESFRNRELTDFANRAINRIMRKMVRGGYLSQDQFEREKYRLLSFEAEALAPLPYADLEISDEAVAEVEADLDDEASPEVLPEDEPGPEEDFEASAPSFNGDEYAE